jgi:hypothetical protein
MFTNEKINGIHISRYIASWINCGGNVHSEKFMMWLMHLGITADDAARIANYARCGKMELESDAREFMGL